MIVARTMSALFRSRAGSFEFSRLLGIGKNRIQLGTGKNGLLQETAPGKLP